MTLYTLVRLVSLTLAMALSGVASGAPTQTDSLSTTTVWTEMVRWEGYRLAPYKDGTGWSVGVGHCLTANMERVKPRYTEAEVLRLFLADLSWALDACRTGVRDFDSLPQDVRLVALQLAWTTGRTGFSRWTNLRTALSYRAYDSAAVELARSRWRTQVSAARFNHCLNVLRSQ